MSNFLSRGLKGVRRALHLPPVTLKNVATKYAPVGLGVASTFGLGPLAGIAGKLGTAASSLPGASKVAAGAKGVQRVLGAVHGGGGGGGGDQVHLDPNTGLEVMDGAGGGGGGTDWLGLAEGGLAGLSALNAAKASSRAGKYQDAALAQAQQRWEAGAPLRAAGQQRLLNPMRPDLTGVFNDPTNAFSRPVPPPAPPALRRKLAS
jgi:hypothetical protein